MPRPFLTVERRRELLRAIKVFNAYDMLLRFGDLNDWQVDYHGRTPGRFGSFQFHGSVAWSPVPTEKFPHGRRKEFPGVTSMPVAKAWAERRSERELVSPPFGGYVTKKCLEAAEAAALKASTASEDEDAVKE